MYTDEQQCNEERMVLGFLLSIHYLIMHIKTTITIYISCLLYTWNIILLKYIKLEMWTISNNNAESIFYC